jgi:hypothetical protein
MVDFALAHRRYWRTYGKDPNAGIPIPGGHVIEKNGKRYAVLYDARRKPVAAYELREQMFALKDQSLVEALTQVEEPRPSYASRMQPKIRRRALARHGY